MADQFLLAGDGLQRTTSLVAGSSDFTATIRFTPGANIAGSNYRVVMGYIDQAPGPTTGYTGYWEIFGVLAGGLQSYKLEISDGFTTVATTAITISTGTEVTLSYVRTGTTHIFQQGDAEVGRVTLDVSAVTWAAAIAGGDGYTAGPSSVTNEKLSYYREWSRALSINELRAERMSSTAFTTTNLVADTPLISDKLDISGSGNHWTDIATASSFVSNTLPTLLATIGALPYSRVVTQAEFNVSNVVWFKYTAPSNTGLGRFVNSGGTFTATSQWLLSDGNTSAQSTILSKAGYIVAGPGDYYLKITRTGGGASDFNFTAQVQAVTVGTPTTSSASLLVNDDTAGLPGTLVDTTGTLTALVMSVPAGELGATASDGTTLWHDRFRNYRTGRLALLTNTLAFSSEIDTTPSLGDDQDAACLCYNGTDFFVLNVTDNKLWRVTTGGILSDTGAQLVGKSPTAIGVSSDGVTCYFVEGFTNPSLVQAWDITGNSSLGTIYTIPGTPFATGVTAINNHNGELLILGNGHLVFYSFDAALTTWTIREITSAGTLVSSTAFSGGTYFAIDHIADAYQVSNDVIYIWFFKTSVDDTSGRFVSLTLSTSVATTLFTTDLFSSGVNNISDELPVAGISASCTMVSFPSGGGGGPTGGTIIVIKVTDPTGSTQEFSIDAFGGLVPVSFALTDGTSQTYPDVTPGSGYGFTEAVPSGWTVEYEVSNDSPIDDITVADGESVIVTITNTSSGSGVGIPQVDPIRRERWFPVVSQEQHRLFFHKLQLYFESGTGINDGQGSNPLVELDWSDDGGHTWSHLHLLESGPMGQYKRRIIQRMMGQSRERIYRVAVSDPVQWSLIDSFFDITEGTS